MKERVPVSEHVENQDTNEDFWQDEETRMRTEDENGGVDKD
jgi:hypothetical protein